MSGIDGPSFTEVTVDWDLKQRFVTISSHWYLWRAVKDKIPLRDPVPDKKRHGDAAEKYPAEGLKCEDLHTRND
jgi:hypothetical protein